VPKLYQTEPSGAFNEWKANAIGRNASNLREFLEKKYEAGLDATATVKLGIETLLEVVENAKNIEICIIHEKRIEMLDEDKLAEISAKIIKEKEAAEEAKKNKKKD
jgi:20S proteasome subunit alpha 4